MENRYGLALAGMVTHANGNAERRAADFLLNLIAYNLIRIPKLVAA